MTCCGGKKIKPISEEEKIKRLNDYYNSLKRKLCTCGGVLESYPGGITICSKCRKRKK